VTPHPVVSELALVLPPDAEAVVTARRRMRSFLAGLVHPEALADAVLLAGELVTNAILHAPPGPIALEVDLDGRRLRVEVHDAGPGLPDDWRARARRGPGGWGLAVVEALADRWGFSREPLSQVWFEIDRARRRGSAGPELRGRRVLPAE